MDVAGMILLDIAHLYIYYVVDFSPLSFGYDSLCVKNTFIAKWH